MKIWQQKIFRFAIVFLSLGMIFAIHANLTTYMDSEGYLHETLSTPLSAFCFLVGMGFLLISLIRFLFFIYFIYFFRRKGNGVS